MTELTMPSVLAFDRKLEPSDAIMYSGNWADIDKTGKWQPIELFERRNRAVKSNFKKEVLNDEEELQKQIEEPNLAWGDDAALPANADTLKVGFSLRVLSGVNMPSACNKKEYQDKFSKIINKYIDEIGFEELAKRYAYNIINGRFLWRNRVGVREIIIHVNHESFERPLEFDAYDYPLKKTTASDEKISPLVGLIVKGLKGEANIFLEVEAYVKLGNLQRVWPSQEMVMNIPKGEKSRHLFALDGKAAIHCEKIGNAIRTIDDWQTGSEMPIAIEAYGQVTQRGVAYRSTRNDFKTLIGKWINDGEITEEEKHFVVAMLIRGGVFSEGES
ncbi:MAG: type I-F CRISPR-associated protein Csy3 [Gammaproteobacteria bacterium]|nr:type I-F CRISPR-associated protein Csy3 [Gammaproteobacteria bacterium]